MPETTPLIKAALNLRGGAGFDVYDTLRQEAETMRQTSWMAFRVIWKPMATRATIKCPA